MPMQWLFFIIAFAGVFIIKGFDNRVSSTMLWVGILSALSSGFAYNMVRSLKQKEHNIVVVLHFQIIGTLSGLVFTLFNWQTPQGIDWVYLLLIGICTQLGQVNLTKALQTEKIANVSILNYLGIIYALMFGATVFGEHYDWISLAGIVLVISGVLLNFLYQKKFSKLVIEEELTSIEE
jgi:drug/metabolite transporter (DMT)-like permease